MMFKDFSAAKNAERPGAGFWALRLTPPFLAQVLVFVAFSTGCQTLLPPLPPFNLNEPGWTVQEGQAVWNLPHGKGELAGDLLVATRSDADMFVQFTKTPFPIVIARSTANQWEAQFPAQNKRYAGRGQPPGRLIWLHLPRALRGQSPPPSWAWRRDANVWRLENLTTGESVEGYFAK